MNFVWKEHRLLSMRISADWDVCTDCYGRREFKVCRVSDSDYARLIELAKSMKGANPSVTGFLFAFLQRPYEQRISEEEQDDYLEHTWLYKGKSCYGLALAYIMESMALSICGQEWNHPVLDIEKDRVLVDVRNLFDEESFDFHLAWLESLKPVELITCLEEPNNKLINLRDDHGKDVLYAFCKRLVNSEYVCEIVNSLPFNPNNRKFIHKIRENGQIEIVLPWTDSGLGVSVQTTGRNYRETEKIAEILKEKYGVI